MNNIKRRILLAVLFVLGLFIFQEVRVILADIIVSEKVLNFGVLTRKKTKSLTVAVKNTSTSPFLGGVVVEKKWVVPSMKDLSLASGMVKEITLTVDPSELVPGDHEMLVFFNDLMGNEKAQVMVKCTVIEGIDEPILKIREDAVDFKEVERTAQPIESFFLENIGSGVLKGQVEYPDWIRGDPTFELHFTQNRPIYIRAYTTDFSPGDYTAEIKVTTNGGNKNLPIAIRIKPKEDDPILAIEPKEVNFGTVKKGKKGRLKIKVLNKGKGRLTGTIAYPEWIEAEEEFKEVEKTKEILLVADPSRLPLGATKDVVKFSTTNSGLIDLPVKIFVQPKR